MINLVAILKSFSQVFFHESTVLGILIVVGLGMASPSALIFAIVGSLASLVTGYLTGLSKDLITSGLYGYNAVLIGVAVSLYIKSVPFGLTLTILLSILSVILFWYIYRTGIPPLVAPFVFIFWAALILIRYFK